MVQDEWRALLERAVEAGRGTDNWLTWYHLGIARHYAGERDAARRAWEQSLAQAETVWALRNLALLAGEEDRPDDAARLYTAACRARPALLPLAVECGRFLLQAGRAAEWLDLLPALPEAVRGVGRMRLLEGQAALAVGDLERAEQVLAGRPVVDDLREGEQSLSTLWIELHARRLSRAENLPLDDTLLALARREFPIPPEIDYEMH
jgi:tetratricopeptide (TPR) repeat protein